MTKHQLVNFAFRAMFTQMDIGTPSIVRLVEAVREAKLAALQLEKLDLLQCNGVQVWSSEHKRHFARWDESDQERYDRLTEKNFDRVVRAIASVMDSESFARLRIEHQPDPRGLPIIIYLDGARVGSFCF